jgi:hypothetical protein
MSATTSQQRLASVRAPDQMATTEATRTTHPAMKRLELQDQLFVEQAADAAKREAAIDRLGKCQKALLWLTLPAILIAAAALFLSDLPNSGLGLLGVV